MGGFPEKKTKMLLILAESILDRTKQQSWFCFVFFVLFETESHVNRDSLIVLQTITLNC